MVGILTNSFEQRRANIAKAILPAAENLDWAYDLIKAANPEQKAKVKKVMDEWKTGSLHSGSKKGPKVISYKQAVAVALSEAGLHKGHKMKKDMDDGQGEASGGEFAMSAKRKTKKDLSAGDSFGESVTKGGEGSRGGKVVGHTSTGKPIYEHGGLSTHYKDFTPAEHREASNVHVDRKEHTQAFGHQTEASHKEYNEKKKAKHAKTNSKLLEKYHEEDPDKFFEVVGKHYEPEDDGESEHTMFENLSKHPKLEKIVSQLARKFKKGEDDDLNKAVEDLFGIQDPVEKAFSDMFAKGGPGSNKAGRVIGTTRSGKSVHVFKEANEYKDFNAVDHLEAHKMHLHHAHKVTGVAAVNSRIRAHDHEDIATIKAAQKENEEITQKAADGGKQTKQGGKNSPKGKSTTASRASKVQKAWNVLLEKDEVNKAFNDVLQKGDISSTLSSYGDKQPMSFSKTGKQISAKLLAQAAIISEKETEMVKKMSDLEDEIGSEPDDETCSYSFKWIKIPRYSYNVCYPRNEITEATVVDGTKTEPEKTTAQLCQQYNDLSYRLVSLKEDLESIRIITENIEGGKKYQLSVGQLASLGF